jgi:hypothetical protein
VSRRPLTGPGVAARMAPGGRLWSESPVRRPYPRVRQAGAPVSVPVAVPFISEGAVNAQSSTGAAGHGRLFWYDTREVGDILVALAVGQNAGADVVAAPAGWTTVATGTLTGGPALGGGGTTYSWCLAWGTSVGSTASPTNEGVFHLPTRYGVGHGYQFRPGAITLRPVILGTPVVTGTGASSLQFAPVPGGSSTPVQSSALVFATGSATGTNTMTPATGTTESGVTGGIFGDDTNRPLGTLASYPPGTIFTNSPQYQTWTAATGTFAGISWAWA